MPPLVCCHDVGHWASMCCEPLRCNNCCQVGHREKCCTGRTAPRPPPFKVRRATQMPLGVRPRPWQPSPSCPQQHPEPSHHPADLQVQCSLVTQQELLCSELQGCLERVVSFWCKRRLPLVGLCLMSFLRPSSTLIWLMRGRRNCMVVSLLVLGSARHRCELPL
jgi:hypothetical protein